MFKVQGCGLEALEFRVRGYGRYGLGVRVFGVKAFGGFKAFGLGFRARPLGDTGSRQIGT